MLKDGWGEDFEVGNRGQKVTISSKALKAYQDKKNKKLGASSAPADRDNDESDEE